MDLTVCLFLKLWMLLCLCLYGTTAAPQNITTTPQQLCVDNVTDCADYGRSVICTQEHKQWSLENCRSYCGYCNETIAPSPCVDLDQDCANYQNTSICTGEYQEWASINCANFCGLCQKTGNSSNPPGNNVSESLSAANSTHTIGCADMEDCSSYGSLDICHGEHESWALLHCPKFCNRCHVETICQDELSDCVEYGEGICRNQTYLPWAEKHCRKFCNICDAGTTPPTAAASQIVTEPATTQSSVTNSTAVTSGSTSSKP